MVNSSQQVVPTVNIVISYDVDAMIAFQESGSFSAFVDNIKKYDAEMVSKQGKEYNKQTHVFTNGQGSSFVGLEHTWGDKGKVNSLSIELIDTQGDFERGMLSDINSLPINKNPVGAYLSRKERELRTLNRKRNSFVKAQDAAKKRGVPSTSLAKLVARISSISDTITALEKEVGEFPASQILLSNNEILSKQKDAHLAQFSRPVFITYGCGESLLDWSPVGCYGSIYKLEYSFSGDGLPIIKMIFAPNQSHYNLIDTFNLEPFGPNFKKGLLTEGYSDQLFNEEANKAQASSFKDRSFSDDANGIIDDYFHDFTKPSLHLAIKSAVEKFIKNGTNYENVLVLLPDLDIWLASYFKQCESYVRPKLSQREIVNHANFGSGSSLIDTPDNILYLRAFEEALDGLGLKLVETLQDGSTEIVGMAALANLEEVTTPTGIEEWFKKRHIYAKMECDHVTQTFLDRVTSLGKAIEINNAEGDISMLGDVIVVTDFQLLNIMEEHGLINDSTTPCLVWGSETVVEEFLYAKSLERGSEEQKANPLKKYINPIDKALGLDLAYMEDVINIYVPPAWTGPFGPQNSGDLDDLAIFDDPNRAKESYSRLKEDQPLNSARLPVFTFGTKNPNVLSVDFDINGVYTNAANSAKDIIEPSFSLVAGIVPDNFKDEAERMFTTISGFDKSDLDEFGVPVGFKELVEPYWQTRRDFFEGDILGIKGIVDFEKWSDVFKNAGFSGDLEKAQFGADNPDQVYYTFMWERFSALYLEISNTPTSTRNITHPDSEKKVITNSVDINERLSELQLVGNISTTPMFHLSTGRAILGKPCLLYCVQPRLFINETDTEERSTWFSGLYELFGFTHKITPTSADSMFAINRNSKLG